MSITKWDLDNRFTYHAPKERQAELYAEIRKRALELAEFIVEHTPESREQSLAVTHLEDAVMWANAAEARHG